ncbi:hypothetical protein, partial [Fodinicola feengrottensis]|uniref:hypothetical protein n=1 Tax=Fodinicola feengrottensis TaxID=435914 RepID=UPI0031D04007
MSTEPNDNNSGQGGVDWDAEFAKLDQNGTGNVVPLRKPGADVERHASSFEVDIDDPDSPEAARLTVADPGVTITLPADEDRREPIISAAFLPANLRGTITRTVRRWLHIGAFHAVRLPLYGTKTAAYGAVGVVRLVQLQLRWWWLTEQAPVRRAVADNAHRDPKEAARIYNQLLQELRDTRRWRGFVVAAQTLATVIAGLVVLAVGSVPLNLALVAAILGSLAHLGRPAHKPIISKAIIAPRFRKLNLDIVLRAYYAAGLGNADKPGQQVQFGAQMARDARGTGSQVVVDLPYGRGWADVLAAKEKIASGLDVHVNQVFLTEDETSSRRHLLFVADRDPLAIGAGRTDL